jgi:uncharacterized protein (DUF39 family)
MTEQPAVTKSIDEINAKVRAGKAVVVTAEEMIGIVADEGHVGGAEVQVDVELIPCQRPT